MNKMIKSIFRVAFIVALITSFVACSKAEEGTLAPEIHDLTLIADSSFGSINPKRDSIKHKVIEMESQPTLEELAKALTQWTGLNFSINKYSIDKDIIYVDWSKDSTLVAGIDNPVSSQEFNFIDTVSLNWFMMDSLAKSIKKNFPIKTIYYSQDGGKPLTFDDGQGIGLMLLPIDQPYDRSGLLVIHSFKDETKASLDLIVSIEPKLDSYDMPIVEVPLLPPDIKKIRDTSYEDMPIFSTQNEVTKYVLYQFLNNQFEFEFYLTRYFATDEATGFGILSNACEGAMSYHLFSAYRNIDLYTQDQGDEDKIYAKIKIIYTRPEYDLEARAEAMEFIAKNPVPIAGFENFEIEKAYARNIHDFVAKKVTYSPIGYNPESMFGLEKYEALQEAYNVLGEDENTAVCAAYARAFALIAQYAGINTAYVLGNQTELESHAWNVIYPRDGSEPVLVDVTWDDTESEDFPGQLIVSDRYFYIPLSEDMDHKASDNVQGFLDYINSKEKSSYAKDYLLE